MGVSNIVEAAKGRIFSLFREATAFADQAVAALQYAVKAGWAQSDELKEADFDALRQREDFQELVRELFVKAAAGGQLNPEKRPAPPG